MRLSLATVPAGARAQDIETSQDIMAAFRQVEKEGGGMEQGARATRAPASPAPHTTQENQAPMGMDLHVQVLTSGFWPRCSLASRLLAGQPASSNQLIMFAPPSRPASLVPQLPHCAVQLAG